MNVKKSKLNEQFNLSKRHDQSVDMLEIFKDISIHINGFVGNSRHSYTNFLNCAILRTNFA